MTLAEFQDVLDARGGDMSLWPAELRQAAERLVAADPQAEACLRQARRLDDLVRHGVRARAALPDAAAARVVGRLTRDLPRQRRFALPWPALLLEVDLAPARLRIAALSAVACLGIALGLFGPDLDAAGGSAGVGAAPSDSILAALLEPEPMTGVRP